VQSASRKCACRRELNSHDVASRELTAGSELGNDRPWSQVVPHLARRAALERLTVSQSVGPPRHAVARSGAVSCCGGLNSWRTTIFSAEREAPGVRHREQQGPWAGSGSVPTGRSAA